MRPLAAAYPFRRQRSPHVCGGGGGAVDLVTGRNATEASGQPAAGPQGGGAWGWPPPVTNRKINFLLYHALHIVGFVLKGAVYCVNMHRPRA